jgi:hypothetical protein
VGWILQLAPSHRSARVDGPESVKESPTAVQTKGRVQETPLRKSPCDPVGLGVRRMLHPVPFHRSARVPEFEFPTAMQAERAVHDTPFRPPPPAVGLGVGWILHVFPFQRSARVPTWLNELSKRTPTATQSEDDVHATLFKKLPAAGELRVDWMFHAVPFQRSASVRGSPELLNDPPTAVQADGDVQDTPPKKLPCLAAGAGIGMGLHVVPFHRSAKGTEEAVLKPEPPTAMQIDREGQAMLPRLSPARRRVG